MLLPNAFRVRALGALAGIAAALSLTATFAAAQAPPVGKASGTISVDDKGMKVAYAYAWAQPNTFEPTKTDIAVLLTDKPVPPGTFAGVEEMFAVCRRLDHFAMYRIDETGKLNREVIAHPTLGEDWLQTSGATFAVFTKKALSANRVTGTISTTSPETLLGHRYAVKVDIDAPVVPAPRPEPLPDAKTGTALPAAGGDPGKAYMAHYQAIARKDAAAALGSWAKAIRSGRDLAKVKEAIKFMAEMQPKNAKVVRGFMKGDHAALYVEGLDGKEKQYGTIEMVREDGEWKVGKESWSSTPPSK